MQEEKIKWPFCLLLPILYKPQYFFSQSQWDEAVAYRFLYTSRKMAKMAPNSLPPVLGSLLFWIESNFFLLMGFPLQGIFMQLLTNILGASHGIGWLWWEPALINNLCREYYSHSKPCGKRLENCWCLLADSPSRDIVALEICTARISNFKQVLVELFGICWKVVLLLAVFISSVFMPGKIPQQWNERRGY